MALYLDGILWLYFTVFRDILVSVFAVLGKYSHSTKMQYFQIGSIIRQASQNIEEYISCSLGG